MTPEGERPDPAFLTDPRVKEVYAIESNTLALDLSRARKETGLTFSYDALDNYLNYLRAFVATRVMKYWEEKGEPPVTMQTLVTVAINTKAEHPPDEATHDRVMGLDPLADALALARSLLEIHKAVQMDSPEDKATHAKACATYDLAIKELERRRG